VSIVTVKDPLIESVTPKTKWVVVLRPFDGSGIRYERGQVVDSTGWVHTTTLVNRRYVAPLPYGADVPEEEVQKDGTVRRFIQDASKEQDVMPKAKTSRKSA
jgi:hypothetical protein